MKIPPSIISLSHSEQSLNPYQKLSYALPILMISFLFGPLAIVQGIYAKYFGLALTTIATVHLVARLFDAISDPIIGYYSDLYYHRTGSRKAFIFAGGILFIISSYFLYAPSDKVSTTYFLFCFLAFYLSFTIFEIPHLAWGGELAVQSEEKNAIYSLRSLGLFVGKILFFSVPLLPFFETNEFTPKTLKWSVITACFLMLPLLYVCLKNVPDKNNFTGYTSEKINSRKFNFLTLLKSVVDNKPFLLFVAAFSFSNMGAGMWYGLAFIFVDSYLGLGDRLALIFIISLTVGTLTLGLWYKLANYLGKKVIWSAAVVLYMLGLIGIGLLPPGDSSFLPLMVMKTLIYIALVAMGIIGPSLLGDIIDYGTLKSGRDCAATYFSFYIFMLKSSAALGGGLGLAIAGLYGFDATATVHSETSIFGLHLAITWLPVVCMLTSLIWIILIPINSRRHRIIRRRLDARSARESVKCKDSCPSDVESAMLNDSERRLTAAKSL